MPLNEQMIYFEVGGQRCHGMLHLPQTPGPHPAVLMLHGFTGQRFEPHRLFVLFSRLLAENGIASLRFDFRGSGESEGTFDQMTLSRELDDVQAAFEYLKNRPEVDRSRLGLLGLSMGGLAAALSAHTLDIKALCLWAPAHPALWVSQMPSLEIPAIREAFKQAAAAKQLPPDVQVLDENTLDWSGNPVSLEFIRDMGMHQPEAALAKFNKPALVAHGTADPSVPQSVGQSYASVLPQGRFHSIEGGLHTFERLPHQAEAYAVTLEFFRQYL